MGQWLIGKASIMESLRHILKDYRDVLEAPKTWNWHPELIVKLSDGRDCYFTHGKSSDGLKLSQSMSCNSVQGHHHSVFEIKYFANNKDIYWSMVVGCLIDDKSMAFAYNKLQLKRPLIGVGIILDGQPKLLPMILNKEGRWCKKNCLDKRQIKYACLVVGISHPVYFQAEFNLYCHFIDLWHKYD